MLFLPRLSSNGQPAATALFPIAGPADTAVQSVQIAPDGRRIVFAAAALGRPSTLWTSSTGGVAPKALEGTEGANLPFWSPDSQAIGFFADGKLKRVPADGGPVTVLCAAPFARGAVWSEHSIVFSAALSMLVVSDGGGKPEAVPGIPPGSVRWPTMLPDRRHFVYFENKSRTDLGALFVASLDGGAPRQIGSDAQRAIYVAPGFLVYGRGTALLAQRFDLGTLRLAGEPTPIATDLWYDLTALGLVDVSTSADGATLMYRTGGEERTQLTWYTRDGRAVGTLGEPATDMNVQLSPDSSRVLLSRADSRNGHRAIWLMDQRDGTRTRLSLGPADDDLDPVWSPDASELAFTSTREAHTALYRRPVSGGEPQRITADLKARFPRSWSEDGKYLIVDTLRADGSVGTEVLSLRDGASTSLEPLSIEGWFGQFSHDGKWIAYSANTSGRFEIYVQPFPLTGAKWQISTGGGLEPRWRRDGSELYFISPDQHLLAVPVNGAGGVMHASVAQTLFPIRITRADRPDTLNHYDVTPDGQRFLLAAQPARSGPIAAALISWQSLLTSR
jgi:Tol biopolymer transport system component